MENIYVLFHLPPAILIKAINYLLLNQALLLDIILSDVWTSLVSFFDGFNYYVIFVDHYRKYF